MPESPSRPPLPIPPAAPRSAPAGTAQPSRREQGRRGEELARRELERRGYRIAAQNARTRAGEIDLVALEGSTLCFVEVRLRAQRRYGSALESVDPRKQRQLVRVARELLSTRRWPPHRALRFDVVAIELHGEEPSVQLIRAAFDAE